MKKFTTLTENDLTLIIGGKKKGWKKALACGSSIAIDGFSGFMAGSVIGTAFNITKDLITKCGVGPQPQKVY